MDLNTTLVVTCDYRTLTTSVGSEEERTFNSFAISTSHKPNLVAISGPAQAGMRPRNPYF
jgi:hypothetical protein